MSTADASEVFAQALREDDAQALYDRAPCGYLSTDPSGLLVKVNQTFLTMTGYQRAQMIGRMRFADLLSVGGRIYHDTHYAPMLQMQGSAREIALDLLRPDGTRLPVLVTSLLEREPNGTPTVIRTAVFDASERRRYEQELLLATRRAEQSEAHMRHLAATLQAGLIPPVAPHIPGLDIATAYHPAGTDLNIGGDFYDVYPTGPGRWIVALGDVSGKGVEAAIVTALIRHTLRAVTIQDHDPAHALSVLNDVVFHDDTDRFCTLVLVLLTQHGESWTATVSLGGHAPPLLCRPDQRPTPIGRPGTLIGALPAATFHTIEIPIQTGDTLLLYTDGVTDARHDNTFYDEARLYELIYQHLRSRPNTAPTNTLVETILHGVLAFQHDNPSDDIALLSLTVSPKLNRHGFSAALI